MRYRYTRKIHGRRRKSCLVINTFFNWLLDWRRGKCGRIGGVPPVNILETCWKIFRLAYERATGEKIEGSITRKIHWSWKHKLTKAKPENTAMPVDDPADLWSFSLRSWNRILLGRCLRHCIHNWNTQARNMRFFIAVNEQYNSELTVRIVCKMFLEYKELLLREKFEGRMFLEDGIFGTDNSRSKGAWWSTAHWKRLMGILLGRLRLWRLNEGSVALVGDTWCELNTQIWYLASHRHLRRMYDYAELKCWFPYTTCHR